MAKAPTYEEMLTRNNRAKTGLAARLRSLKPGAVVEVSSLTNAKSPISSVNTVAHKVFGAGGYVVSKRGENVFVARLRDEDRKK